MVKVAIITLSDSASRGERVDESGEEIRRLISSQDIFEVTYRNVLPDEVDIISNALIEACEKGASLVITTGGTGIHPRDVTPEATMRVIEREVPGISELIRLKGLEKTPMAALSRGVCGLRGNTLIINLPGSKKAVRESMEAVLPILKHAIQKAGGDERPCSG